MSTRWGDTQQDRNDLDRYLTTEPEDFYDQEQEEGAELQWRGNGNDRPLRLTSLTLPAKVESRRVLCVGRHLKPEGWTVTTLTRRDVPGGSYVIVVIGRSLAGCLLIGSGRHNYTLNLMANDA